MMVLADKNTLDNRKVKYMDAGKIPWVYDANNQVFHSGGASSVPGIKGWAKIACTLYTVDIDKYPSNIPDKTMSTRGYYFGGNIYIRDLAYTNAEDFKQHMKGVILAYETN